MKRILIVSGVIAAIVALILFNQMTSKKDTSNIYAEVKMGLFEITVSNSGELIAERSIDVKGPEISQSEQRGAAVVRDPREEVEICMLWNLKFRILFLKEQL